jgi:lipoyl(octanoyl) transferase
MPNTQHNSNQTQGARQPMRVIDLGVMGYQDALQIQKKVLEERISGEAPDTLILVEHQHIYTAGRAAQDAANNVVVPGVGFVPTVAVERGGKLTYHGPGQLVGYPIFSLTPRDIRLFLRDVEKILITSVSKVGISARPCPENLELEAGQLETGVWVGDYKIGSIGIAVKQWVSYHGFSLNIAPDLRYFQAIEPCGFDGHVISSIAKEKELSPEAAMQLMPALKQDLITRFSELSNYYASVASGRGRQGREGELPGYRPSNELSL